MADYRLYYHNDAPVMRSEDFEAPSDAEAIMLARAMKKRRNCQLWSVDRFVAVISSFRANRHDP